MHISRSAKCLGMAVAVGCFFAALPTRAQDFTLPPPVRQTAEGMTNSGFSPRLPQLPQRPARPTEGPESIRSFLDNAGTNDAVFEVVLGQGRLLTTRQDIAGQMPGLIAVGDPAVLEFEVVGSRQIRLIGRRIGVTDLSITTSDDRAYSIEVSVVVDLDVLRAQLGAIFPDAALELRQIRDHIVIEGEAHSAAQVTRIIETLEAYLASIEASQTKDIQYDQLTAPTGGAGSQEGEDAQNSRQVEARQPGLVSPEVAPTARIEATVAKPRIINLLRVLGAQQVMLKVRIAEMNRTKMRRIGISFLINEGKVTTGSIRGGGLISAGTLIPTGGATSPLTAAFGIFDSGAFEIYLDALRQNSLLKLLAEPNLVAMSGHEASFLSGGEFPVPVPQNLGGAAGSGSTTVQFREFGVRLAFIPYITDDETIRLYVAPEVSSIDEALGATLVPGGTPIPGLNTRKASTTVEMREGQTLAIAGLIQLTQEARGDRTPFFGDVPLLGSLFRQGTTKQQERELVVLVTPTLVQPMTPEQVPPLPGSEYCAPTDYEFYLMGQLQGSSHPAMQQGPPGMQQPLNMVSPQEVTKYLQAEDEWIIQGPHGHSRFDGAPAVVPRGYNSPYGGVATESPQRIGTANMNSEPLGYSQQNRSGSVVEVPQAYNSPYDARSVPEVRR